MSLSSEYIVLQNQTTIVLFPDYTVWVDMLYSKTSDRVNKLMSSRGERTDGRNADVNNRLKFC